MNLTSHARAREIKTQLRESNWEALLLGTGAWENDVPEDHALIGVGYRCSQDELAVYSYTKLIRVFADMFWSDGGYDTYDDAELSATEWVDFNIVGAWVGEMTPIILMDWEGEE